MADISIIIIVSIICATVLIICVLTNLKDITNYYDYKYKASQIDSLNSWYTKELEKYNETYEKLNSTLNLVKAISTSISENLKDNTDTLNDLIILLDGKNNKAKD